MFLIFIKIQLWKMENLELNSWRAIDRWLLWEKPGDSSWGFTGWGDSRPSDLEGTATGRPRRAMGPGGWRWTPGGGGGGGGEGQGAWALDSSPNLSLSSVTISSIFACNQNPEIFFYLDWVGGVELLTGLRLSPSLSTVAISSLGG